MARKLTAKQERFVEEYLVDCNATQAAIRAGYSERYADRQGSQLLGKTRVSEAIAKARAKISEKVGITTKDVIQGLHDEATNFDDGSSHSARVSAWSWLGKHFGMFPTKVEASGPGGGPIHTARDLTDEQLAAIALGGSQEAPAPKNGSSVPR